MPAGLALGPVTFLAPLALLGLLALPLIWWLLQVTPPSPKKQVFPPLRILQDVMTDEETPDSTPLWLLLFRLLLIAIIAVALARPILFQAEAAADKPIAIIIDDGWDGAANWTAIVREAEALISDARRKNLEVLLAAANAPDTALAFGPASDAMRRIKTLRPSPLPSAHGALAAKLGNIDLSDSEAVWLSGGIDFGSAADLAATLSTAALAKRLAPNSETIPLLPGAAEETASGFRAVWHRADTRSLRSNEVTAHASDGVVIARADISFAPGAETAEANFELPSELRSRVAVLRASGINSAGSVKLLDDSWGRPLIGILTPKAESSSPLLSEPFYAQTALTPYADIFTGSLGDILPLAPSIIIMPDAARTTDDALKDFVEAGGLLIRFAGPRLAKRPDSLLPVLLRSGGRELGGALTWEDPQKLAPFPEGSPFFGLKIQDDIVVKRQVMAQPGAQTDSRTWARLKDGSPIVTSAQQGFGRIVLFHVTAGPEWSNLPVGGLYVDMLRRLLSSGRAAPGKVQTGSGDWAAERVLNGFGRLGTPPINVLPIKDADFADTRISREHPPGLYRQGARRQALNTVSNPAALSTLGPYENIQTLPYGEQKPLTLGGMLLGLALFMLALDAVFGLIVSGRLSNLKPRRIMGTSAALIIAALFIVPMDARAQNTETLTSDALELYLAYVKTGDSRQDRMSEAAMTGLMTELGNRTTIEPMGVRGVNPETDPLLFYPFLYWPVDRDAESLSPKASAALNGFMAGGGTIVFDTRDAGDQAVLGSRAHPGLARITASLDVPRLTAVPEDHVLTKSFYLLQVFPGRWANGTVWVDRDINGAARDGVSSVIIGSNDWAAGWAVDGAGAPMQTLERDIPKQREMAQRFGVNLAMYALAGNYKSDQVHAAALIDRLGQGDRDPENLGPSILLDDEGNP